MPVFRRAVHDGLDVVGVPVILEIEVDPLDGFAPDEVESVALDRLALLPLEVSLGGVPLGVSSPVRLFGVAPRAAGNLVKWHRKDGEWIGVSVRLPGVTVAVIALSEVSEHVGTLTSSFAPDAAEDDGSLSNRPVPELMERCEEFYGLFLSSHFLP